MDSVTGPSSGAPLAAPTSNGNTGVSPGAGAGVASRPLAGSAAAPITVDGGSEVKKTKLEGGVTEIK